ncbi:ComEA family DNA-binding protein [Larkinella soli]|uniref:ComEA family DNA-binding protein n=1 Tax=Larkinella soli TaxID=1770527 RepID=UPI000FFC2600|nr:helix-hairpin-helix domain-containing protein [Larkinella soli]
MRKAVSLLRDFFGVSQQEARGLLALLVLIAFLLILPIGLRLWLPDHVQDTSREDRQKLDSLVALLEAGPASDPAESEESPAFSPKTGSSRIKRFPFDPNTVSVEGWQQLGLPRWLAERVDRYRAKGGRFRKKEDLKRIYDFPPELYAELEPWIRLETPAAGNRPERQPHPFPPKENRLYERPSRPVLQPFDINNADTTDLKKLRGIGSRLAARILKFREALGGFASTGQFSEVFGLDSLALTELLRYGQIHSPVSKLAVNTATAEALDRHPYLNRRQAEAIVSYRSQHGPYTSVESLRPLRLLDPKTIERLAPYLAF